LCAHRRECRHECRHNFIEEFVNNLARAVGLLICGFAQSTSVSGSFGFLINSSFDPSSVNPTGLAILGFPATAPAASAEFCLAESAERRRPVLNGSYGFQFNILPNTNASLGVAKFDGAGHVALSMSAWSL
jgi:hypothetical protein